MLERKIADAGLIIAFLDESEGENHDWAAEIFSQNEHLHTCEAVLAEACARLVYGGMDPARVLRLVTDGTLKVDFSVSTAAARLVRLMDKYADRPMDLADACLVVMTEDHPRSLIYTLDESDFSVYRRNGREVVPFESPPD